MLDRESTFAHPGTVELLKTRFVPVAIDQAYQRRQKDTEGDFYRKLVLQSPMDPSGTTQGFYVGMPDGELLLYNNNRDPNKLFRLLNESLEQAESRSYSHEAIERESVDRRYSPERSSGGLVLRVRAKVLGGYAPTEDRWRQIFQSAVSRDNMWVNAKERTAIVDGSIPVTVQRRLARYHLVDNTRGEPPMWSDTEIKKIDLNVDDGVIVGTADLRTKDGSRGFVADLRGRIEVSDRQVRALDLVALGEFWGEGRYTRGAPKARFPLAITFRLADGEDPADRIPPQGSRGWIEGYLR